MNRCSFYLLSICLFAGNLLAGDGLKGMKEPYVDYSNTSDKQIVMRVRPLLRKLAAHDTWRVAIHWSRPEGPFQQRQGLEGPKVDLAKTLANTKFVIEAPAGESHEFTADVVDRRHEYWRGAHPLFRHATLILALDKTGIHASSPLGDISGKWRGDSPPDLANVGRYKLQIAGALNDAEFKSGELVVEVDSKVQRSKSAFDVAYRAIAKHLPNAKLAKSGWTESGYVPGMVYEDVSGDRLLHFNTSFSKQFWGYDLVRVKVTRHGQLAGVYYRGVDTCIAEGTPIATPHGARLIETLRAGDVVLGYDPDSELKVATKVRTIRGGTAHEYLLLGDQLRITSNHPVFTPQGWRLAGELTQQSELLSLQNGHVQAPEIKTIERQVQVFDLTVDAPHNYFAGGLLVHNKDRAWSASLDDPWNFNWPEKPPVWKTAFELKP